jgi:hypothetical protein
MEIKNNTTLWAIMLMLFILIVTSGTTLYSVSKSPPVPEIRIITKEVKRIILTNENDIIEGFISDGKAESIIIFYNNFIKNERVTRGILFAALANHIPVDIMFASAWQESSFNPDCISKNKKMGKRPESFDVGLFQLNTLSFSTYSVEDLKNIELNCSLASTKLRENFEKYGNWEESVIAWNAGNTNCVYNTSIKHLAKVYYYKDLIDKSFYSEFCV